ncbi:MAG TPA: two-component regulator propeller domain-containing protein [Kofleriaceae bacterium]|nr:two-component regulator propeller domain-containing protein [Kofleriaceae bacterium]
MKVSWLAAAAVLGIAAIPARALGEDATPHGLVRFRSFGSAQGLHNLVVFSIAQDVSGSLWIGTDDGVSRYDGEKFTHFGVKDGLPSSLLLVLGTAPDGNVCVGGVAGLACWDGERFARAGAAGLPAIAVHAMASAEGRFWVGTEHGLYVREPGAGFVAAPDWPGTGMVKALWADAAGVLAADDGKLLTSAGDGAWRERSDIGLAGDRIEGLVRDRAGAIWIRSSFHVWRLPPGARRVEDLTAGVPTGYDTSGTQSMVLGRSGEVVLGSDVGVVYREADHWRVVGRSGGLPSIGARTVFVDRDGSTWVGSVGLYQERGNGLIERYDVSNGLPGGVAWSFARDRDGTLWAGTHRCLARMRGGSWSCLPGTEGRVVRTFVFPPQGGVFLGGAPSDLLYVDPAGHVQSLGGELGHLADHIILSLRIGPEGDLWIATKIGLFRLPGAVPGPLERVEVPGIPPRARFTSLIVAEGRLWATSAGGLAVRDADGWHALGTAGFPSAAIRYLVHTHGHEFCAAYAESIGVSCFEVDGRHVSRMRNITVADGLTSGTAYYLGYDRRDRLWVGTGDGVDVVTARGIDHFGEADGLAGDDSAANAFFEDRDGSLWLGSTGGASQVFASRYDGPPPPPAVVVRGGQLGDRAIRDGGRAVLETSHDLAMLQVEFGTRRLADADRVAYQVRLSPVEHEWTAVPGQLARYPSLPPGAYHFEVRARLGAGAWGPVTELAFSVRQAWWQRGWFWALAGCALVLVMIAVFAAIHRSVLRRRTRQLAEQSAANLRSLLERVPDLISVHRGGELIYCNLAARRLYGVDDAEIEGLDLADRIHPDDRAKFAALMQGAPRADAIDVAEAEIVELRVRDGDGDWRICEVSGVRTELAGARVLVASGRDVTERHRLRAQLLVSDRMASLGTLAAGVAHEINNPLSYVLGNLQVMTEILPDAGRRDELAAALVDATDGAQRVRKIVQGLRSFSRAEEENRVQLDIADVLRAAIRLTANEVRHRARMVCELGATPRVVADDGRLTQVFINLIVNAAHAIPEGRSDANRITVRTFGDPDGHAVVEVEDTGSGMSPEVQARAFDPFFTTKEVGRGTGLGLSICHGIISVLGGRIAIDSAIGRGTRVRVVLPPAVVAAPDAPAPVEPVRAAARRLRILAVDDEPRVLEMLARVLRREHDVVAVSCGGAALQHVRGGARFDVIVSDVMMPNMTGLELLDELVRIAPDQARRMIFLSGGVFTAESRARLDELGALQLEKPVTAHQLREAVRALAIAGDPPIAHAAVA